MSLLMKALEKAAKDRGEARGEPQAAAAAAPAAASAATAGAHAGSELSLEPMAPAPRPEPAPRATTPPPAVRPAAPAAPARDAMQEQAGTVLQAQAAGRPASGGMGAYLRAHPVLVFGTLAALVAIGFGIYVYLQIFHPQLFIGRPPVAPSPVVPPLVQAPPVSTPPSAAPAEPLSSAPLLKEAARESAPAAPAAEQAPARPAPRPAPAAAPRPEAPRNAISISAGSPAPQLNPQLTQAYGALQAGRIEEAKRLYGQLAAAEPKNVDALLGLAAIATRQGDAEEASRRYLQILELEPRHALAQSGLISLYGRADPLAAESRLRQLIAREPSAFLYFTLGNVYADQGLWAPAQQVYFQAHHLEPANPDYAYNLAVALEHVSQPRLALGYYQRAVELATARGHANFGVTQAQERAARLARQVE